VGPLGEAANCEKWLAPILGSNLFFDFPPTLARSELPTRLVEAKKAPQTHFHTKLRESLSVHLAHFKKSLFIEPLTLDMTLELKGSEHLANVIIAVWSVL
jgi:hypothetical protein